MMPEAFPAALAGRRLESVERRGHFLRFELEGGRLLIVNAMLVGRYVLAEPSAKDPAALVFALRFVRDGGDEAIELRYLDDKRMGKVYVLAVDQESTVPAYRDLGVDLLSSAFTWEHFQALAAKRRDQVRNFLLDKSALASIGNAYADEILFSAHLHPKTFVNKLTPDDLRALYDAIGRVLRAAIEEIERRDPATEVKVRDFLAVRGRSGEPCRACGTKIRSVRVGAGDADFCPKCQPAGRKLFIDWSRASGT